MEGKKLTDFTFWENYWLNKKDLLFEIPANYPLLNEIRKVIQHHNIQNLIEIGGFPGYYSVWASSKFNISSTLLDFYIIPSLTEKLKDINQCKKDIQLVQKDLFSAGNELFNSYDLCISNGLIEHFEDTQDIINRHINYLKPGGTLFISLPNFTGLNGWFQKKFDPENYEKHYIRCMDPKFLKQTCIEIGLTNIQVNYSGKFMLWLENEDLQPQWVKIFKFLIWLPLKIFFKIVPIETKWFSPYLYIIAKK